MPDNFCSIYQSNILEISSLFTTNSTHSIHVNLVYSNGLVQGRCNSIANALELRLSCTNPWICDRCDVIFLGMNKVVSQASGYMLRWTCFKQVSFTAGGISFSNFTHRGQDNMCVISQTTFSSAFPWMNTFWGIIDNMEALVQIMAWRWTGDKPLFEPMMV